MEPRIQYAKTTDGVSIAFWVMGAGPPYVWAPDPPFSHIQLESRDPFYRQWFDLYAANNSLVRFDARGTGLSDRDVEDLSFESRMLDLEAVVDKLGYETFALGAQIWGTPPIIAYAAEHPERVSRLVLFNATATGMEFKVLPRYQTLRNLLDTDWELYTENVAAQALGLGREEARNWAPFARAGVTPDTARRYHDIMEADDVTQCLPEVSAPTLVLQLTGVPTVSMDAARRIAAGIANTQMVVLEGDYSESLEEAVVTIAEFVGHREDESAVAQSPDLRDVHTILFTDMESSSALRQRLGDAKAQDLVRTHNRIVRDGLKAHGGSEIKHTGDGIVASFPTASGGLECAVAIQRGVAAHVEQHPDALLGVYIGLNAGEPIAEEKDLFGTSVDLARRICDNAQPGQILASDLVAGLAAGKGFVFEDQGEASLKGFDRPVRLYELRWREED